jgi:hypothetical protein
MIVLYDSDLNAVYATCVLNKGSTTAATCQFNGNPNGMLIAKVGADAAGWEKVSAITKRGIITGDAVTDSAIQKVVCGIVKGFLPEATCKNVDCP